MNQLLKGEPMTILGDGLQQRAFTHVSDVSSIIAISAEYSEARNQIFNIGADSRCTLNELAHVVAAAMNKECKISYLEPRNEAKIAFSDHSKKERVFGTDNQTSLEDGIRRMAEWVTAQGARESGFFENIEVAKNMPPSWAAAVRL
jgi:UDP-glucose 4-epimerase